MRHVESRATDDHTTTGPSLRGMMNYLRKCEILDCGANCDELAELLNYNNIESLTADGPPKYWICL